MQIFSRAWNRLPQLVLGTGFGGVTALLAAVTWFGSPKYTQAGYSPKQPIPYSHRLHAREYGLDCRYCHAMVERSAVAMIPPTQTCMNCHQLVKTASPLVAMIKESWDKKQPIEWVRIHKLPDHAYFDHSAHVLVGVGCSTCHGRIDLMEQVKQVAPLSMGWCLDCHRDVRDKQGASAFLRPTSQVTNMEWKHDPNQPVALPKRLDPPENCSACHR